MLLLSGLFAAFGSTPSAFGANFEIAPDGFAVRMLDPDGDPEDLAGSHPDRLQIDFALTIDETSPRDLVFELPPGFGADAAAVPPCPQQIVENKEACPAESQVGVFEIVLAGGSKLKFPFFQLESLPGQPAAFGSTSGLSPPLTTELRPGDFGITIKASDLPHEPIVEGHIELWGVPADHQESTSIPRRALLTTPSSCGPLDFTFRTRSWQEGSPWLSATADTGAPLVGCEELSFAPQLGLQLDNPVADAPTGLRVDLSTPEEAVGSERASAQIKNVTVEMPSGIGLSPGGAEGLVACTDAQLGLGNDAEAQCPQSSRVGSVELSSPALNGQLGGTVYLGEEKPGERFRVFVVAHALGTTVKIAGAMRVNPATGRLVTELNGLPPISIQRIGMIFDGGPRALLASPLSCGTVSAVARFDPYGDGPSAESTSNAAIQPSTPGSPCTAPPFAPELLTLSSTHRAGQPATFSSILRRRPGEQLPRRFSVTLPPGFSARLGTVDLCPEASVAAVACPPGSRVGGVRAEVGSGPTPAVLRGDVYLTDSYRRAPFGVLVSFQAAIGPFDLGTIALRGTADLNPRSARLTVSMDPLPDAVEGVPVRFQTIELNMDRPGFIRNPTSCSPKSTDAWLEAQNGAIATATSALELHGCNRLGFKPSIQTTLVGRDELHKGGRPGLRMTTRLRPGGANLRAMRLTLPPALKLAVGGLEEICSRQDALEGVCPDGSRAGSALAKTSLLKGPLIGSIYVAQPRGSGLPDMWVSLVGGGIRTTMRGKTSSQDGRLTIELGGLPDLPLSSFTMRLEKGKGGAISLGAAPCSKGQPRRFSAAVAATGQNGSRRDFSARIGMTPHCAGAPKPAADDRRRSLMPVGWE